MAQITTTPIEGASLKCPYLTTQQAATFIGCSRHTLEVLRIKGGGPEFMKVGPRRVVYLQRDLEAWVEAGRRKSTADDTVARARR
ncbi:AlpA family transcriptional regulator [Geothrix sp. 21YS21S-4]|uniref:helix-turn-helix transcriptional regulator n=1 Tax=Geothrix sp. 21YS21S-4 TaxID=3068889 RepID=UPI0027BAF85B|nr:helix-turn-helix domain-containing protein [Geothrix sp. 21YS21S-4]